MMNGSISTMRGLVAFLGLITASFAAAESGTLEGTPLEGLTAFLGNWEVETQWADGTPLWARNEFRIGLGGNFIEASSFTKDENDKVYERYYTIFANDTESDSITSYGYTYDGSVTIIEGINVANVDGFVTMTTEWSAGADAIRQTVSVTSNETYHWKVWAKSAGQEGWALIMDTDYQRVD